MGKIKKMAPWKEGEFYCPDCGMKLEDDTDKTLNEHFRKDCMGILTNSLKAYNWDLSDAEMGWIRCSECNSIHLETVDGKCVCGECGTLIPDGPVLLVGFSVSIVSRISRWIRGIFHV